MAPLSKQINRDGLPTTVCYICVSQLQRCRRFSDKAHASKRALTHLLHNDIEISHSNISAHKLSAIYPLTVTVLPLLTAIDYTEDTTLVKVKEEIVTTEEIVKIEDQNATEEITKKEVTTAIEVTTKEEIDKVENENIEIDEQNEMCTFICRVCLGGNVRMYSIENNYLKEVFEKVTSLQINTGDGLPTTVCYICASQLHRCRRLSHTAHESARALTYLLHKGMEISRNIISAFNLDVKQYLTVTILPQLTVTNDSINGNFLVEFKPDISYPHYQIKNEVKIEAVNVETADEYYLDTKKRLIEVEIDGYSIKQSVAPENNEISYFRNINKQFVCKLCNKKCVAKITMIKHLRTHKEKPFSTQETDEKSNFRDTNEQFVSKIFNKKCKAKYTLIKHIGVHQEKLFSTQVRNDTDKKLMCKTCDKTFKFKSAIIKHLKVHQRKPVSTQECNEISYFRDNNNEFVCKICNRKCKSKKTIVKHVRVHTGEKPTTQEKQESTETTYFRDSDKKFVCKICQRKCISKITMVKHVKVHPPGEKPYVIEQPNTQENYEHLFFRDSNKKFVCKICDRKSPSKYAMINHLRIHTGEKPFACDICNKTFKQKSCLNYHKLAHGPDKPIKRKIHVCNVCSKTFGQVGHLKQHMLIHTGDRPFSCTTCNKTFTQAGHLKQHIRMHTGEKPYTCNTCSTPFSRLNYLKQHMLVHTEDTQIVKSRNKTEVGHSEKKGPALSRRKSFPCSHCDKAFCQAKDMKLHMLVHTGEKPYNCDVCAKSFNHPGSLKNHKRIHTGEKPYVCDVCAKSFNQATNLNRHKATHTKTKKKVKKKPKKGDT